MKDYAAIESYYDQYQNLDKECKKMFLENLASQESEIFDQFMSLISCANEATSFFDQFQKDISLLLDGHYQPGTTIANYQLEELIGFGGMGYVYRASRSDGFFNRKAAIKFLNNEDSPESITYFKKECHILAGLHHENIVQLYDGGITKDGTPYFIMEYVEGTKITDYCKQNSLPLDERLDLFSQLCEAIAYCHKNNIVHCDIKPGNVMVDKNGKVKLTDFGISRYTGKNTEVVLTENKRKALTLEYASPEMKSGDDPGNSSDIYQLGLLLYELSTDKKACNGDKPMINENLMNRFPPALFHIIKKCTQYKAKSRYANVHFLISAIQNIIIRRPISLAQHVKTFINYAASISL